MSSFLGGLFGSSGNPNTAAAEAAEAAYMSNPENPGPGGVEREGSNALSRGSPASPESNPSSRPGTPPGTPPADPLVPPEGSGGSNPPGGPNPPVAPGALVAPAPVAPNIRYDNLPTHMADLLQQPFDTTWHVKTWFDDDKNFQLFLYGIGKLMKTKEESYNKSITEMALKEKELTRSFEAGGVLLEKTLTLNNPSAKLAKDELTKEVLKANAESSKTLFFEIIKQKETYSKAIDVLGRRKKWIVDIIKEIQAGNTAKKGDIVNRILASAQDIYGTYRGIRYEGIRNNIFNMIKVIAFVPEAFQGSLLMNTSITGPAGSGKTTLARKIAEWYSVIGLLTNDAEFTERKLTYREVGRENLIASYMGQTAPKVIGALYDSLEQTLFIDEAYAVAGCSFDQRGKVIEDSYGSEFVSTMLPFLANHKGLSATIVAGYRNLMELCFFQKNEGLPRRFPVRIDLPLYTTDELYNIFIAVMMKKITDPFKGKIDLTSTTELAKLKKYKYTFYSGFKMSMMMIHFGTEHTALELLRKYILTNEVRQRYRPIKYDVESCTIINHVLTCMLESELRRNIMRFIFYRKLFDLNKDSAKIMGNLSFFPAQAGEMELLADTCLRTIELSAKNLYDVGRPKLFIDFESDADFFNGYFHERSRNITIDYTVKEQLAPDFTVPADRKQVLDAEVLVKGSYISSFKTNIKSFLINKAFEGTIFETKLPTLKALFAHLKVKENYIMIKNNVIKHYNSLVTENIGTQLDPKTTLEFILELSENDFPVNMIRSDVEVEQKMVQEGSFSNNEQSLFRGNAKFAKIIGRPDSENLQHPDFNSTNSTDTVWEDFGIV